MTPTTKTRDMEKIMFNDFVGLTQAVLSGRKTMTRRVYKTPRNSYGGLEVENNCIITFDANGNEIVTRSKYRIGEVVAVAQAYRDIAHPNDGFLDERYEVKDEFTAGWSNKMFVRADLMPNRIRITNVRVEWLNDISESDCRAEGIDYVNGYSESYFFGFGVKTDKGWIKLGNTPREAYAVLIDRISGKGTWESNPYVFVYDFELVK